MMVMGWMTETSSSHHVAWADRIGINKQWARDIEACSDSYGTPNYKYMVKRFKNNIPNIRDGPQLKDMINTYFNNTCKYHFNQKLFEWKKKNPQEASNESWILKKIDDLEPEMYEELYEYMIQLLEDHGFGFYKSKIDEVEEKML